MPQAVKSRPSPGTRSEEHTSELQSQSNLVCRLLLEKKTHKWLFTPIDCSAFYVRDPAVLKRAFSLVPDYLKTGEDDVTHYMDWGVQLCRRFRALQM